MSGFLIPESWAGAVRQVVADDHARSLRFLLDVAPAEAAQRGEAFADSWIEAGCPPWGAQDEGE